MAKILNRITNCLWFDKEAEEAAKFYTSLFPDSGIDNTAYYGKEGFEFHGQPEGSVMTVEFRLGGLGFLGLNGGPVFKINPSVSFFAVCDTLEETDKVWNQLVKGGSVLMALDKYPWSEKYGWLQDRFGVSWQIAQGKVEEVGQRITPSLLFVGKEGHAEAAMKFYTSIFKESKIEGVMKYEKGEQDIPGNVKHAQFRLLDQVFMAMDSSHDHKFNFNEGVSFCINCTTQEEIDRYWAKLTEGGEPVQCGWLKDRFGVSWQVVPVQLSEMLKDPDKAKTQRVTKAFMQMKKFDIEKLEEAFEGA
ncbi:VOC family protein [Flavihumibacter solisilvae]|uniref:3-demethylubiquinone-9 3-methyltransferase n=1 Tax=Flavihumibacter solisilvae TaxID=1349421 RepID=A0A0C1IPU1_9BACT|nr:VOC family protein [Flavihumibacter solisilvae]KIC96255.1 3-demethylubiquinone-9 3-methyltransferase [Flavihumibacter solisilvae]